MAAPDIKVIAAAVASGYASLTPPTGYPAIRRATDRRPNAIPTFPFVTVDLPEGEMLVASSGMDLTLQFRARLWLAKHTGDQARDDAVLLSWLGILLLAGATTVNTSAVAVSGVKSALAAGFRYFVDDYASTPDCFGWEFDIPTMLRNWPLA